MPKTPIDYLKTLIYKLCCNDTAITQIYVGSTTNWTRRKQKHKETCNRETHKYYNCKNYQFIRANGGWDNWSMIQIEAYPCQNKREAEARERYWYELLGAELNIYCPFTTEQEKKEHQNQYDLAHKEEKKQYYKENKEQIKEYKKQYYLKKKAEKNNL